MSVEPKHRLFVAVDLPSYVREAIEELVAPFRSLGGFRWTPTENLHLTLAFLGWVEPAAVDDIRARVAGAAADRLPFEARLGGAGRFPERGKARVLWVGFDDPDGALAVLASGVRGALGERFPPDDRPFRPHVTVARAKRPVRVSAPATEPAGIPFRIDEITLFRSRLGGEHARYESVDRWPLGAQPARIP